MTNRWMKWLAKLATQCAVLAMAATWGGAAFAQGNAPGGVAGTGEFSGSLQEGAATTADYLAEEGTASTRVSQTQYIDEYGAPLPEMQGPPPTFYDANVPNDYGVGYAVTEDLNEVYYRVGRVNRAFNDESTSINAFIPLGVDMDQNLWFINPRAMFTDQDRGGASVGVGRRFYVPEEDRVYGMSAWWDYDAGHAGSFHQLGGSFEAIGRYLQWRFNFSVPLGSDTHEYNFTMGDPFFFEDNIAFLEFRDVETSYQQYDLEAAIPAPYLGRYGVTWGVGPYFLNGRGNEDAWGVSTRAEVQITEDLWANLQVTSDKITGGNAFLNFEFTLPNGMPRQVTSQLPVRDWMTQSVRRNYRVVTNTENRGERFLFINPEDGLPIRVAHIDPNDSTAGIGTVEDPYESVADFMGVPAGPRGEYDIIFVRRNADGTDTDLNTTITLLECQRLLGDGIAHEFDSTLGTFDLPGITVGLAPLLSNSDPGVIPGTPVITLASGNEVSGFTIDATDSADGIFGAGIDGFNINRNTIQNVINGIVITSDTTPLTGCPIEDVAIIEDNIITGNGFGSIDGVNLIHTAGDIDLRIGGNTVTDFRGEDANGDGVLEPSEDTIANGVLDPGEDTNLNGVLDLGEDVDGDATVDQGRGIAVLNLGGTMTANDPGDFFAPTGVFGNTVIGSGTGIQIIGAAGSSTDLAIEGNTITASTNGTTDIDGNFLGAGLDVAVGGAGSTMDIDSVTGNVITGGAGDGASFLATGGGVMTFADPTASGVPVINGNTFDTNAGHGATFEADTAGVVAIESITENSFDGNGQNGANFETRTAGTMTIDLFQTNTATGNTEDGVSFLSQDVGSTIEFTLGGLGIGEGNTITGNLNDGIFIGADDGAEISGAVLGNTVTGNLNGLNVAGTDGGIVNLFDTVAGYQIMSNDFSGNTGIGAIISAFDGDVNALMQVNTVTGNGSFGVFLSNDTVVGPSTLDVVIGGPVAAAENIITGNGDAGIAGDFLGTSETNLIIQNNTISGNINAGNVDFDGEGVHLRTGEFANLVADVFDNSITGNAAAGFRLFSTGDSTVQDGVLPGLNIARNTITGNGANGVFLERDGDAFIDASLTENTMTGNTGSGLFVNTTGGNSGAADTLVFAEDNIFSNNTLHGVNFLLDGSSATFANLECNEIDANGVNGITVTTTATSFFGDPLTTESIFSGNTITNHVAGAGISLNQQDTSTLLVDIISNPDCQTVISGNLDGVVVNVLGAGTTDVTIGDAGNPFPDVIITENTDNAVEFNVVGGGTSSLDINNTSLTGNRLTGGASNNGLDVNYTGSSASTITVTDTTITNFGVDGINVLYDRNNDAVGSLAMTVTDSAVGQDLFNFNGDDGWDILVQDGGASFVSDGSSFIGNAVDGIRFRTVAEAQFDGSIVTLTPGQQDVDVDGDLIPDFVSALNPTLNARPDYVFPWGDNNVNDFTSSLSVLDGSVVNFNGRNGVRLEVGSSTTQNVSLQGSDFSGNTVSDIDIRPIVSGNPVTASTDQAQGSDDIVVLDPMADLNLLFGNLAPNTGNQVTQLTTNPAEVFNNVDVFKGNSRAVMGDFSVTVPNNVGLPTPNNFTFFGAPIDETTFFPDPPWNATTP